MGVVTAPCDEKAACSEVGGWRNCDGDEQPISPCSKFTDAALLVTVTGPYGGGGMVGSGGGAMGLVAIRGVALCITDGMMPLAPIP